MSSSSNPEFPRGKKVFFALGCVLFPLLLLLGVEGALRLAGWGGYTPFFRRLPLPEQRALVVTDKVGSSSFFFANPNKPGTNDEFAFFDPKPEGTLRVFLVGGSVMKGFPQPIAFSAASFLQAQFDDLWPGRKVEVINLGTTAVASFPVSVIAEKALAYEPDLVVVYTAHNEFFGAYGVASANRAIGRARWLRLQYLLRQSALVQALAKALQNPSVMENKTLMEFMAGTPFVATDSPLRARAADFLRTNLTRIVARCRTAKVPVLLCVPASNEQGLAPLGRPEGGDTPLTGQESATFLQNYLAGRPTDARAHFRLAQRLEEAGERDAALTHFMAARDLDTMPWRAPSSSLDAVRQVANDTGTPLCDVEEAFRAATPSGAVGWDLMDDHVHLSIRGQALLAETLLKSIIGSGLLPLDSSALGRLRPWEDYARLLGDNPYDRYGVSVTLWRLFEIPFMKKTNPDVATRLARELRRTENRFSPEVMKEARNWQDSRTHAGGVRPLSGMVGRALMREKQFAEARDLFPAAMRSVPPYSSWYLEYAYLELACAEKLNGHLNPAERQAAQEAIERGELLLQFGHPTTGFAERYMGRLHQLRGAFEEAIPYLLAARSRMGGIDLVATDQALALSYMKVGRVDEARELASYGAENSGTFAPIYRNLLKQIDGATLSR